MPKPVKNGPRPLNEPKKRVQDPPSRSIAGARTDLALRAANARWKEERDRKRREGK